MGRFESGRRGRSDARPCLSLTWLIDCWLSEAAECSATVSADVGGDSGLRAALDPAGGRLGQTCRWW